GPTGAGAGVTRPRTAIVGAPRGPDGAVEPGVSCMSCHVPGIIVKADQMRDHVARNPQQFSRSDAELIRALYPPEPRMRGLMEADGAKYQRALAEIGVRPRKTEAGSTL